MAEPASPSAEDAALAAELDRWEASLASGERSSLVDLVNRVLDRGVVITGHVTISVAGVDLVYLGLNAVLTSVAGARRIGAGQLPGARIGIDAADGDGDTAADPAIAEARVGRTAGESDGADGEVAR